MRQVPGNWGKRKMQSFGIMVWMYLRQDRKVRWTVTADKCMLFDDWSPMNVLQLSHTTMEEEIVWYGKLNISTRATK